MLYDVPQTDSVTEAAMAALVLRLRTSAPKPEAITAGPETDTLLALFLARWIGRIGSALGDRVTGPILQWDGALDGVCIACASRDYYNARGRNRQAGADTTIDALADDGLAFLARCRPGGDAGKTENPVVICADATPRDAPYVGASSTADSWIERRSGRATR